MVLQVLGIIASLVMAIPLVLTLVSRRFRLRLVRSLLGDYAQLQTYAEMGQVSGDVRAKAKVRDIVTGGMVNFLPRLLNNPLFQLAYDYFMTETEIGDLVKQEPQKYVPILISVISELAKQAPDLSGILSGFMQGGNASGLSEASKSGNWWE